MLQKNVKRLEQKAEGHGKRRQRRTSEQVLNRIVEAASAEFKQRGFAGATTAAIAQRADVTEAQLFRYFRSKSHLFRETIFKPLDEHISDFFQKNAIQEEKKRSLRDATHLYATQLQDFITEHTEMFTSLIVAQLYNAGDSEDVSQIDSLHKYFEHAAANMAKRIKGREVKIPPHLLVRIAFAAVLGCVMFRSWLFPTRIANRNKIRTAINDFIMEGLSADLQRIAD